MITRTFRFFGNFRLHKSSDPDEFGWESRFKVVGNLLEIFYFAGPMDKKARAFARVGKWRSSALPDPPATPPAEEWNVFSKTDEIIQELLEKEAVSFWICEPEDWSGTRGRTLVIHDAIVLDQYRDRKADVPTERFPLVATYKVKKQTAGSVVCFGTANDKNYAARHYLRIETAFALPRLGEGEPGALASGVLVPTSRDVDSDFTSSDGAFSGRPGGASYDGDRGEPLGQFGYSDKAETSGRFTILNGDSGLWPDHRELALRSGIGSLGKASSRTLEVLSERSADGHVYAVTHTSTHMPQGNVLALMGRPYPRFVAKQVRAETIATCKVSDETIGLALKTGEAEIAWELHVVVRARPEAQLSPEGVPQGGNAAVDDLLGGGLQEVSRISTSVRQGLAASRRLPQSVLPVIAFRPKAAKIAVPLIALAKIKTKGLLGTGVDLLLGDYDTAAPLPFGVTLDTKAAVGRRQPEDRHHLPADEDGINAMDRVRWQRHAEHDDPLTVTMRLPGFDDGHQSDPSAAGFPLILAYDPRIEELREHGGSSYSIWNDDKAQSLGLSTARLGSVAMAGHARLLVDAGQGEEPSGSIRIRPPHRSRPDRRTAAHAAPTISLELSLRLALNDSWSITADIPHGDRDERPADILIREDSYGGARDDDTGKSPLEIRLVETVRDDQDRRLVAELKDMSAKPSYPIRFTVLTDAPFSAYRFSRRPFNASGTDESLIVAVFDSDGGVWQLRKSEEVYRFDWPAGAVGEDADKPGRLELHDAVTRGQPLRPALKSVNGVVRRLAVDMRYSPPTTLWVRPSDLQRNYLLPEYAARDLFRQRGDFGIGVGLVALRSEAVYGLASGLLVPPITDGGIGPRVAELSAVTGITPLPVDNSAADKQEERWLKLHKALQKRPERLEIWTLDRTSTNPFVPAHLKAGLNISLRHTALLAPPVDDPRVLPDPVACDAPIKPPRFAEHGLAGGALWPIESANVARVVASAVTATGGELDKVAISPTGLSADQKASFLNGYVTIATVTREKHLQEHRVEVLGRIAGLWHRARHVVTYLRTTSESAQFVSEDTETRSQRAVIRKVDEFVEILEPERRYPDVPGVDPVCTGFLESVRFNSRKIAVNSAWGRDLGRFGWMVPLWNRGEAEIRPQVFPEPDVAFLTRAEGRIDDPISAQECRDTQLLYFFTDTEEGKAGNIDTDVWPAREHVDFCQAGHPSVQREVFQALQDSNIVDRKERRPADSRLVPGLRQFTWRLAPSPVRTRINSGMGDKPVYAGVESVSFMRGFELKAKDMVAPIAALADTIRETAPDRLPIGLIQAALPIRLGQDNLGGFATFKSKFESLRAELEAAKDEPATLHVLAELKKTIGGLEHPDVAVDKLLKHLGPELISKAADLVAGQGKDIAQVMLKAEKSDCGALAKAATDGLRRRKLMVLRAVEEAQQKTIAQLDKLPPDVPRAEAWICATLSDAIKDEISGLANEASQVIGGLGEGVATARAIVADWKVDANAGIARARGRLHAASSAIDRDKPFSRDRLDRAIAQLDEAVGSVEKEIEQALDEARRRVASEIAHSARGLGAQLTTVIASIVKKEAAAQARLASVQDLLADQRSQLVSRIETLPNSAEIAAEVGKIEAQIDKLTEGAPKEKAKVTLAALKGAISPLDIDKLKADATRKIDEATVSASDALDLVKKSLDCASSSALEVLGGATGFISAFAEAAEEFEVEGIRELAGAFAGTMSQAVQSVKARANELSTLWKCASDVLDQVVEDVVARLDAQLSTIDSAAGAALGSVDRWLARFEGQVGEVRSALPKALVESFTIRVVDPALDALLQRVAWPSSSDAEIWLAQARTAVRAAVNGFSSQLTEAIDDFEGLSDGMAERAMDLCKKLVGARDKLFDGAKEYKDAIVADLTEQLKLGLLEKRIAELEADWESAKDAVDELQRSARTVLAALDGVATEVASAGDHARAYVDGGVERFHELLKGDPSGLPGKALNLVSFLAHSPEIAGLQTNADRIRMYGDQAKRVLETPEVRATLNYLGDALKALGLDFNVKQIADSLNVSIPEGCKFKDIVSRIGGIDLSHLMPDTPVSDAIRDAVKVTHDLDTKAGRAWVRVDVSAALPDRQRMYSIGPFTLFMVRSQFTAFMRAEASKDRPNADVTDMAELRTDLEAVVAGQVMLTLADVRISYSSKTDLDFKIDPTKIRIHQSMRFIQDMFGSILGGDGVGPLKYLRENKQIVGVEHQFALPPLSFNFGTSGVSNIQIANRFSLRAFPDFVIANRFNLSRRDLPFIFSIFVIGGTGYLQVDTEYRPFDKTLLVVVEAGVGGSASLAFSFGPVSGGVYITLSVVLRYQKRIGPPSQPDDGLSVSMVLVIAGNVSLWGMVTVYLGLMLSMSYHESGRIDATGQLSVEVRISRWFKLKYSTQVRYKLRDGRSSTEVASQSSVTGEAPDRARDALEKLRKLDEARKSL